MHLTRALFTYSTLIRHRIKSHQWEPSQECSVTLEANGVSLNSESRIKTVNAPSSEIMYLQSPLRAIISWGRSQSQEKLKLKNKLIYSRSKTKQKLRYQGRPANEKSSLKMIKKLNYSLQN